MSYWAYLTLGQAKLLEQGSNQSAQIPIPNKKLDSLEAKGYVRVARQQNVARYIVTEEGRLALLGAKCRSEDN